MTTVPANMSISTSITVLAKPLMFALLFLSARLGEKRIFHAERVTQSAGSVMLHQLSRIIGSGNREEPQVRRRRCPSERGQNPLGIKGLHLGEWSHAENDTEPDARDGDSRLAPKMFLQRDAHELAARSDAGFLEKLL